jgi:hypothetical protein
MTAELLSAALNDSFASSTLSFFADDDNYQGKFSKALNALFEDESSHHSNDDGDEGKLDHRSLAQRQADEALAERFMHSLSDLLGGNEVLFDSSCQSLSIYDLTTPLSPKGRKSQSSEASDDTATPARKSGGCGGASSVATDTTVSQTSKYSYSDSNDASKEFHSSIRNVMNSFSEIVSGGRAFTSDECDKVKREIVRLRQLRRRMSASERFGVDFAGFSRSAHKPGTEHGKRRALNLEQQKRQLANIMAWDVEGWKQKALLSNSGSDLSVDGFHDKKELREYIEQKYGMKQVSDLEKSRKPSKPRTSNCPVPLTRIDEDGVRSPTTPRARGRITVRSLEQIRRSTSTPRTSQKKSAVDQSLSPSRRRRETATSGSSPSRHRPSTGCTTKDGISREMTSPPRHRHSSPSERSRRPAPPSERSRRASTPTDRSKRTTTPVEQSRRATTPTERSRRAMTPSDRSARVMPTKDATTHGQCRSPSSRRGARTTPNDESKTPAGRARRSTSPTTTPGRQPHKELDASKSKKRTQSPPMARTKRSDATRRASKLPSVPNLSSHGSLDDATSMSSNQCKSSRHSSPTRQERTKDGSGRRRRTEQLEKCMNGSSSNLEEAIMGDTPPASACDLKEKGLNALRRGSSGDGTGRTSQHSCRSVGELSQSDRKSRSTHLSSLTTHLARTTARRRGRSCARSVHSSRSASTTADRSNRSQRSSIRRSSIGASSRSQRLSRTLDLTAKSPCVDDTQSQHSRRSLNTRTSCRSRDTMATTEHSDSRFDSSSADSAAPKTPMRRGSALETVASDKTTIQPPTVATSATDAGATTSSASTLAAGNGEATPRRRTVRHDLAEIIRGNTASSDSVASPPSSLDSAAKRHEVGKGSSHHPRSSIKMMLSPQRRTIRDFLKSQPGSMPNSLSESSCHQTVG